MDLNLVCNLKTAFTCTNEGLLAEEYLKSFYLIQKKNLQEFFEAAYHEIFLLFKALQNWMMIFFCAAVKDIHLKKKMIWLHYYEHCNYGYGGAPTKSTDC